MDVVQEWHSPIPNVDPFRASLTSKTVEALVCASDWVKAEDFHFYIEPVEDDIQLYKELEALELSKKY